jgi:hypothetical protein
VRRHGRSIYWYYWLGVFAVGCVGCGVQILATPTLPKATRALLGLTQTARSTLLPTPTFRLAYKATASDPLGLLVSAPTCYPALAGGMWCLGLAHNKNQLALEAVLIGLHLVSAEGESLVYAETALGLAQLPAGQSAPYAVLFKQVPATAIGPVASTVRALPALTTHPEILRISEAALSHGKAGLQQVTGQLQNNGQHDISRLAVVITLLDSANRVTGYKVWQWQGTLAPQQSLPFSLEIIPLAGGTTHFMIAAETLPAN